MTAVAPKRPSPSVGWRETTAGDQGLVATVQANPRIVAAESWRHRSGISVFSTVAMALLPDGSGEVGLQWHLSFSRRGHRPGKRDVVRVRTVFGMKEAEEDNHHPGVARHLWLVVDPARRVDCECKATEVTVVERDGYAWQNATDGPCRGCAFERMSGRPCPIHGGGTPTTQSQRRTS